MADKRMIDCNFLNESGFQKLPNKAKLLYYQMITRGDNKGFVGSTNDIIENLTKRDTLDCNEETPNNDYVKALIELIKGGFLYEFNDNYGNMIHLIRHWFIHNKNIQNLSTNYVKYLYQVKLVNNVYHMKDSQCEREEKETIKENKDKKDRKDKKIISNNDNELLPKEDLEFNDIINDIESYGKEDEE